MIFALLLLLFYILYLIYEKYKNDCCRRKCKHVIHVNGIRGKSAVARLIAAGLSGRYQVFCKTTGTVPMMLYPDGTEREIQRIGLPNIKEQIATMKEAGRCEAEVAVLECMALNPSYQAVCTQKILQADISVITNVRQDHTDIFGPELTDVAHALSCSIGTNGLFFTTDGSYNEYFEQECKNKNTKAIFCVTAGNEYDDVDFTENVKLALCVCEQLGVTQEEAFANISDFYKKDPGSMKIREIKIKNTTVKFVDLLAVNDVDSLSLILQSRQDDNAILLLHNRKDRPARLLSLAKFIGENQERYEKVWLSGGNLGLAKRLLKKYSVPTDKIVRFKPSFLQMLSEDTVIIAIGNYKGFKGWDVNDK